MLTTLLRPTSARPSKASTGQGPARSSRRISVVIQESAADLFLSVVDNFATFGRFHGLSPTAIRDRTEDVLEQFELRPEANRKVMDLSGGFKRRVQVAKVFMIDTPVVFLDEFSTGMDPLLKRSVMARLRQEAARGRTIVLTTQILSEAEELCDDILIIARPSGGPRRHQHAEAAVGRPLRDLGHLRRAAGGSTRPSRRIARFASRSTQNGAHHRARAGRARARSRRASRPLGRVLRIEVSARASRTSSSS